MIDHVVDHLRAAVFPDGKDVLWEIAEKRLELLIPYLVFLETFHEGAEVSYGGCEAILPATKARDDTFALHLPKVVVGGGAGNLEVSLERRREVRSALGDSVDHKGSN